MAFIDFTEQPNTPTQEQVKKKRVYDSGKKKETYRQESVCSK